MKFKPFKRLKSSQKVMSSKAFYTYFKTTGQFNDLPTWEKLPAPAKVNYLNRANPSLHKVLVHYLSSYDIPKWHELKWNVRTNNRKYYEALVEAVTGVGEVFKISGVISYTDSTGETPVTVPIEDAVCTIDDETVTTDSTGAYEFTGLFKGVYTLKVSAEGFENKTSQVTINNADVTRNLTLTPTE